MDSRRAEFVIDLAWLAFAGGYCAVAAGYPPGGRMVPLTIGLVALALGLLHFAGNFMALLRPFTHADSDEDPPAPVAHSELVAALWAAALLACIFALGAVIAVFLFFLFYFGLRAQRWRLGFASAIVMTLITWGLFGQLIALHLPVGVVPQLLMRLF